MNEMISFSTAFMGGVAQFLWAEPMRYVFTLALLAGIAGVIKILTK